MITNEHGIPRRIDLLQMTTQELALQQAIRIIEDLGAHVKLTEASVLLQRAKECVSDYVDERMMAKLPINQKEERGDNEYR
jgi:hypothetical protein